MLQVIPLFICALSALVAVQAGDDCRIAVLIGDDTYSLPCETDGVIDLNEVFPLCATGGNYNGTADSGNNNGTAAGGNTSGGSNSSASGAVISEMSAGVGAGGIGSSGGLPGGLGASGGRPGGNGGNARLGSGGPAVDAAALGASGAGIGVGLGPFSAGLGPSGLSVDVATPTP